MTPELIKADEQLSVELWDSDRNSADDIVGKVELSMQKLIQHPGKMYPQISKLTGMEADSEMPGELHWEVGYFGKPHFRPALRTDGKNNTLPDALRDQKELQDAKGVKNNEHDDAVMHTPPDPLWPSGVCSVIIHQIVNLELENIKGTTGSRKGREFEPAKPAGENSEEQSKNLPTSYCVVHFNDVLVGDSILGSATNALDLSYSIQSRQQQTHLQRRNRAIHSRLEECHHHGDGTRSTLQGT